MLTIMEAGMADGIVILPVHDGCLCLLPDISILAFGKNSVTG
jgi:hypothetical protein